MARVRPSHTRGQHRALAHRTNSADVTGSLRRYALQHGTAHALSVGETAHATVWLTDFAWLQTRTRELPSTTISHLADDFAAVARRLPSDDLEGFEVWAHFFSDVVHLLRLGTSAWPANRILLQLAIEHADDSAVTLAAEAWLKTGDCDWLWLRRSTGQRAKKFRTTGLVAVLEGHTSGVDGVCAVSDDLIVSWSSSSDDAPLIWDIRSRTLVAALGKHRKRVAGIVPAGDNRLVSRGYHDNYASCWDAATGNLVATWKGHPHTDITGITAISEDRILVYRECGTVHVVNPSLQEPWLAQTTLTLRGHNGTVRGVIELPDQRLLEWSDDAKLRIWSTASGAELVRFEGHGPRKVAALLPNGNLRVWEVPKFGQVKINGASVLSNGHIVSWSNDCSIRTWDTDGRELVLCRGHTDDIASVVQLDEATIVSASHDKTVRTWNLTTGEPIHTLLGHDDWVLGCSRLPDGRILSWSRDGTARVWNPDSGRCVATFEHSKKVNGARALPDSRILTWSEDQTLRVWGLRHAHGSEATTETAQEHRNNILWVIRLRSNAFMTWSSDGSSCRWSHETGRCDLRLRADVRDFVLAKPAHELEDGGLLVWDTDVRLLHAETQETLCTMKGHTHRVRGAWRWSHDRVCSWDRSTLRVWDVPSGEQVASLDGHKGEIRRAFALPSGALLSWGDDEINLWTGIESGDVVRTTLHEHTGKIKDVRLLKDGRAMSWAWDATVRIWSGTAGALLLTLRGHEWPVKEAIELDDGRILSRCAHTVRLWDSTDGTPLGVLAHNNVEGAAALADGDILTWSREPDRADAPSDEPKDRFRLWHGPTCTLRRSLDAPSLHAVHPDLFRAYQRAVAPNTHHGRTAARGDRAGLTAAIHVHVSPTHIPWHADGAWHPDHLLPDGTIAARCGKRFAILHLHQGDRRVSVDDAESLLARERLPAG